MLFRTVEIKELKRKHCIQEFQNIIPVRNIHNPVTIEKRTSSSGRGQQIWALTGGQYEAGVGVAVSGEGIVLTTVVSAGLPGTNAAS